MEPKFWKREVSKNAPSPDEENEPIGDTIGAEMAKRMRDTHTHTDTHTHRHTDTQALCKFVNRYCEDIDWDEII